MYFLSASHTHVAVVADMTLSNAAVDSHTRTLISFLFGGLLALVAAASASGTGRLPVAARVHLDTASGTRYLYFTSNTSSTTLAVVLVLPVVVLVQAGGRATSKVVLQMFVPNGFVPASGTFEFC